MGAAWAGWPHWTLHLPRYLAEVEASIRVLGHMSDEIDNVEHEQSMQMSASRNLLLKTDLFISVTLMFVAMGSTVRASRGGCRGLYMSWAAGSLRKQLLREKDAACLPPLLPPPFVGHATAAVVPLLCRCLAPSA